MRSWVAASFPEARGRRLRRAVLATSVALTLALGGCSDDGDSIDAGQAPADARGAARPDPVQLLAMLQGGSDAGGPPAAPRELAAASTLVVSGTVEAVNAGRMFGDEPSVLHTVVLVLHVDEVLAGSLPEGGDGNVYIEFTPQEPGRQRGADIDPLVPRGARAVAYLVDAPNTEPWGAEGYVGPRLHDPAAGRPAGQGIWQLAAPRGFLLEGRGGLVRSGDLATFPRASVADVGPGAERFPQEGAPAVPAG